MLPWVWSQAELNADCPYWCAAMFRRNRAAGTTYKCTGTAPKKAKTVAESELMSFLNRMLLWLTWLLPNLNCESEKVHGLYMLLAVAMDHSCLAVCHQKRGISRKSYSLALSSYWFPLSWCLSSMAELHSSQHILEIKDWFCKGNEFITLITTQQSHEFSHYFE